MKTYTCTCGKTFNNPQKFNGHKQGCPVHLIEKYGSLEVYYNIKNRNNDNTAKHISETAARKREAKLAKWISEEHKCERCGKIMTEYYGSGRFCSRFCANSKPQKEETRAQIGKTIKTLPSYLDGSLYTHFWSKDKIDENGQLKTARCVVCDKELPRGVFKKTCSDKCYRSLLSQKARERGLGGPSAVSSYGKRGTYRGVHCDSTYELAFLIYCLDHNITITRNTQGFPYTYEDKHYNYYPDFYLADYDVFIETKGRDIGPVYEKAQAVVDAGRKIKILHYEDLTDCFRYVVETYKVRCDVSSNTIHTLYDDYVKT